MTASTCSPQPLRSCATLTCCDKAFAPREAVQIQNVTDEFGVLVVSGPRSRELLSGLTTADLSNAVFPWLSARSIEVAGIALRALRVSYVGELGWELHAPMHSLPALYDAVWKAGAAFGIANYGLYAVNSMRIEKGYKAWSAELTNELDLLEADMARFIKFDKPDFVGKTATQQNAASSLRIVCLDIADVFPRRPQCGCAWRRARAAGRPLHRRDDLRCVWPPGQEEPGFRMRRLECDHCRCRSHRADPSTG